MAAIVNPLAAHLRRGERKVGKRRRIDHYSFSEPCRMPASYWIAANINYFMLLLLKGKRAVHDNLIPVTSFVWRELLTVLRHPSHAVGTSEQM